MTITIKTAQFSRGVGWITEGFDYFSRNPLGWIGALIIIFISQIIIGMVPLIGWLAVYLSHLLFVGGMLIGCVAHARGKQFELQHIFSCFQSNYVSRFIILAGFYLVANIFMLMSFIVALFVFVGGVGVLEQLSQVNAMPAQEAMQLLYALLMATLFPALILVPVMMVFWFAPMLLVTTNVSPVDAMLLSFKACLKNVPAFTMYGLIALLFTFLAMIPLGLGFFILLPMLISSIHIAFLDCFSIEDPEATRPLPISK